MYQLITQSEKPDRLQKNKDIKYHSDYARFCISDGFNSQHNSWLSQCNVNRSFWANNQWIFEEDLEVFLKDESNQSRNRIKATINLIGRQVAQYIGNAKNLNITMRAENLSYKAINRREAKLAELLFFTELANSSNPATAEFLRKKLPIGKDSIETEEMFNNLFTDEYTKAVNNFITYIYSEEELEKRKGELAFDLALTGMNILKYEIHNNEYKIPKVTPENYFWDKSALEYDLSDAEYMGELDYMLPQTITEKYDVSNEDKHLLFNATKDLNGTSQNPYIIAGKVPVYKVYWVDIEEMEFGYVLDEFGYPYLTRVNYIYEGAEKPRYTDTDLIPISDLSEQKKKITNGSNKAVLSVDLIRYAHIIPNEVLSNQNKKVGTYNDIVLESGVLEHQDTDSYKLFNVKFPYKVYCWYYFKGFVYTPINDLINPQRLINRYESVSENLVNTATPATMIYDKSMVDEQTGEADLLKKKYQGKPIGLDARGRSVHNAIGVSQSTMDFNALRFNSAKSAEMASNMDRIIGTNEALRGENMGSEQLVGVTALQIQRASLVQEPFYTAIVEVYKQITQSIANVARRLYSDDDRKLSVMIGDKKAELIKLSKEYATEYFRVFVNHEPDIKQQVLVANQILAGMLAQGLINKERYADLYGRSTPEDIAFALREQVQEEREMARVQRKQMAVAEQEQLDLTAMAMAKQEDKAEQERADRLIGEQLDRENKLQQKQVMSKSLNVNK